MSEAMTNREIEDVLTSIRRLVAQEGGRGAETGKLVLTEAQRVNGAPVALVAPEGDDEDIGGDDDFAFDPADYDAGPFTSGQGAIPAPDFGRLEATIAELEAAVSASGQGFEAEGEGPRASNVTELYGRMNFVHRSAENLPVKPEPAPHTVAPASPVAGPAAPSPETAGPVTPVAGAVPPAAADRMSEAAPEALFDGESDDDILDTVIDEAMLRQLVAQIVREELHGQLGERITQQVRKLVRAEIAKALDDRSFL